MSDAQPDEQPPGGLESSSTTDPAPIPALPYYTGSDDSWRGLVRLMLLLAIIMGCFNILMATLLVVERVQAGIAGLLGFEVVALYVAGALQLALGIAQVSVSIRGRRFAPGADAAIVRVLWFNLFALTLFVLWTAVEMLIQLDDMRDGYLTYWFGYYAEYYFYGYVPPIVGLYVFGRAEVKQLFNDQR